MGDKSEGERIAFLEATVADQKKELEELERQKRAMWDKMDTHAEKMAAMSERAEREHGRLAAMIDGLDRDTLKEAFKLRTQIAEIGWKVGLIISGALLLLNVLVGKIDLGKIFG